MVDEECAEQKHSPSGREQGPQDGLGGGSAQVPNHALNRMPEAEQKAETDRGRQHVGRAFDRRRKGEACLESGPCHHAMLQAEQGDQAQIDDDRFGQWLAVDGVVHGCREECEIGEEGDQPQECGEENEVGDQGIAHGKDALHGFVFLSSDRHANRGRDGPLKRVSVLDAC